MALPELLLPASLPPFKAGNHVLTPTGVYGQVERHAGPSRRRRVFRTPTWDLQTELEVSQAQLEEFFAWHEGPLEAGAQPFTAHVAKIGTGRQYWKAYIVSVSAEHLPGNLHSIRLRLLLVDDSLVSDTAPALTSLAAEAVASLLTTFGETAPYALFAEASAALTFAETQSASALMAEAIAALFTEFDGAVTGVQLFGEAYAALTFAGGVEASLALAAEATAALSVSVLGEAEMAAEATAALSFGTGTVGYVASPAALTLAAVTEVPAYMAKASVQYRPDGTIWAQENSDPPYLHGNWRSPAAAGVGNALWVRCMVLAGTAPGFNPVDVAMSGNAIRAWVLSRTTVGTNTCTLRIDVAIDPDFLNIVSVLNVSLSAQLMP